MISHAGLNTTLTALGCGVPVLAIPITNEQPGIAARLAFCGAGRVIPVQKLSAASLRGLVVEMLSDSRYRKQAQYLQTQCQAAGGVVKATDLIEGISAGRLQPRSGC